MRKPRARQPNLLRCAEAAGYGAVSFGDDDAAPQRVHWRAVLRALLARMSLRV